MEGGSEKDLQALMGFASFGRPRKRMRHNNNSRKSWREATGRSDTKVEGRGDLHDVVPGTEVEPLALDEAVASALRISPRGVALLTKSGVRMMKEKLKTLLDGGDAESTQEPRADGATLPWALPFSSHELLEELRATKARFGELDPKAFAHARCRANPYEAIGRHRFINRSAMKVANLDSIFQWTQQHRDEGDDADPFVFADVCGGPGGFSEYLLWRTGSQEAHDSAPPVTGFGISLKGMEWCDWKVGGEDTDDEGTKSSSRFQICYGADGTGDLYKVANIHSFRDELRKVHPNGARLVVADGGFPDARDHSNQESMMARLVLAEALTAFSVLRVGGSFLCKTFELTSPLMLQLMWLLHQCFEELTIVKPVTSRPASSERYVVAQKLHADLPRETICSRLESLVQEMEDDNASPLLFRDGVDADVTRFLAFIAHTSERHTRQQIAACEQIIASANGEAEAEEEVEEVDHWRYYRRWRL